MRRAHRWVACAAALAGHGLAPACGEAFGGDVQRLADGPLALAFRTVPDPVLLGRHFAVEFEVCDAAGAPAVLRVDARMPEHRHGMNYRASVVPLGAGRYRAEGLMFHMPGRWELYFDLQGTQGPVRLARSLQLE